MEGKKFRSSNIDLVSYLVTKGIRYNAIEKTATNKIMFIYYDNFEEMVKEQNIFVSGKVNVNINEYMRNRKTLIDIIMNIK